MHWGLCMEFLEEAHKVTFVYLINLTLQIEAVLIFQLHYIGVPLV